MQTLGIGFGLDYSAGVAVGLLGGATGSGPAPPSAPVLSLLGVTGNAVSLAVDVDNTVGAGDTVTLQAQATGGNWSSLLVNTTHTITSGEDGANEIDLTPAGFANGVYDFQAKVHHAADSAWSNTVSATVSVPASPVNSIAPVASGDTSTIGNVLSVTNGTWTGAATITYAYQWKRGASNISGATASTYALVSGDAGAAITCVVTATNGSGSASQASNALTANVVPVNSAAPVISGTPTVGQILSSTTGTWSGAGNAYTYQWRRAGGNISGATASSYTLVSADAGNAITCNVTATNGFGNATATSNSLTTGTVSAVMTDHAEDASSQTTYTWSRSFAVGAAGTKKVVVGINARAGTVSTPSVFINGSAATQIGTTVTNGSDTLSLWELNGVSGTTVTISATFSSAPLRAAAVVYSVGNSNGVTPTGTAVAIDATNNASTGSPVVPVGGAVIIVGATNGTISSATPTNFTQDLPATLVGSTFYYTAGHDASHSGSTAYTITWATVPGSSVGIFAAFSP